ncbi:MAG TPA: hypothetical protein VG165_00995 [Solirubrobacteraceae bacterium]|jgi:hypothetical protein|nr:hypothetical protein [Solirubrobacteraceae bacterium]
MSTLGMIGALDRLRDELRAAGGLLAGELLDDPATRPWPTGSYSAEPDPPTGAAPKPTPGSLAATGPRAALATAEYEFLVEAIYEGYLLHYEIPRLFREGDPDMALLVGDRLYALGLERLVALGDITAVVELADVISLCALAHARGHGELAGPIWSAGARAVGWGPSPAHAAAKALVRTGDDRAGAALDALNGSPGDS